MVLQGITTDGAALYPTPIREVCGTVLPQRCLFHVSKDLTQGVLRAVAPERARLAKATPQVQRGRPASNEHAARRWARKSQQVPQTIQAVFQDRLLFVRRRLTPSQRQRLIDSTRGLPQVRKLRDIMEHIYAVFDRRCRTPTARGKRQKLRQGVPRFTWIGATFQKVFSPNLAKALTFLDDTLLPATSHAGERGHRRHRKMQKHVYRVRSKVC